MKFKDWTIENLITWLLDMRNSDFVDPAQIPKISGEVTFNTLKPLNTYSNSTIIPDNYKAFNKCDNCIFDGVTPDKSFCKKFNLPCRNVISCKKWDDGGICFECIKIKTDSEVMS